MALYTVEAGDSIWNIADRSLGLRDGKSAAPPSNQEIADEMLRIIAVNLGKLKVPKGSKGTPGPADLIHAGLVLDLGGAPSPTQAITNGQKPPTTDTKPPANTKPPTDLEQEKTPPSTLPSGGHPTDPGGSMSGYRPPEYGQGAFASSGGGQNRPPATSPATLAAQRQAEMSRPQAGGGAFASSGGGQYRPGPPSAAVLAAQRAAEMSRGQGGGGAYASSGGGQNRPAPARNTSPWGGREPGPGRNTSPWGGREPGPGRNTSPWGGREPGRVGK